MLKGVVVAVHYYRRRVLTQDLLRLGVVLVLAWVYWEGVLSRDQHPHLEHRIRQAIGLRDGTDLFYHLISIHLPGSEIGISPVKRP